MLKPTHIIIHHSGTLDTESLSWGVIRRNCINVGYSDISYHFGIEYVRFDYEILVGRMLNRKGAHCIPDRMNYKAIGICFVGNFSVSTISETQLKKGLVLVRYLKEQFNIHITNILGHNEVKGTNTECPGKFFDMPKFRAKL